ncbi:hypothetical protein N7460_008126 [Penicillium canescens]|uniref:Intradiol ring-cleavage dioxygenases domain-containing protein n=1 Tax=Penicillium canescens TaxID=5083 RepID=A0AAD6I9A4_PENCN|nr:hypothetical protein N7460_008126 [Penicillium canescens]
MLWPSAQHRPSPETAPTSILRSRARLVCSSRTPSYYVDGEMHRHDACEGQEGINFYLDLGKIDVETSQPLYLGTYSGYVGTDPDAVSAYDDRTMRSDGTTDDETFLRGISKTNEADIGEFRTIFAGYYSSRMTHIHATVQTNLTNDDGSYSDAATKHVGQLFFPRELINSVYQLAPYYAQLTFNLSTVPSTMRIRFALLLMTMGTML